MCATYCDPWRNRLPPSPPKAGGIHRAQFSIQHVCLQPNLSANPHYSQQEGQRGRWHSWGSQAPWDSIC